MKKILLLTAILLSIITAQAQTLYEVKYFDRDDNATYRGLFFYTDDETCFLRCVTEPDKNGNYNYWERDYYCDFSNENGDKMICFIPKPNENKDEPVFPTFVMQYDKQGSFSDEIYVIFQDVYDDEELQDENIESIEYFKEVDLAQIDENYILDFYDEDEEMYSKIINARNIILSQSNVTNNTNDNVSNQSVTMHLLMVAATEDESIGKSVKTDLNLVTRDFKQIAQQLNIKYNETIISGNKFNKSNIEKAIANFNPGANDIAVFIYSGHGFRYNDDTDAYPRMFLTYDGIADNAHQLSTTEVYNTIVKKKARFTLFLTDCCNSNYGATRAEVESACFARAAKNNNVDVAKLRDLFINGSGTVRATAAKAGQCALCDASGGFLLTSVLNNIKSQVSPLSNKAPSWNKIIENASKYVEKKTANDTESVSDGDEPQIVVRSVKVKLEKNESADSVDNGNNTSNNDDEEETKNKNKNNEDFTISDILCLLIPVIGLFVLIAVIVKIIRKKKA